MTIDMGRRSAHLSEDRCTRTGKPLWWVDLATEEGVEDQASFDHDQREAALAYCASWVGNGMILEYARCDGEDIVIGHGLLRTFEVRDGKVVGK